MLKKIFTAIAILIIVFVAALAVSVHFNKDAAAAWKAGADEANGNVKQLPANDPSEVTPK